MNETNPVELTMLFLKILEFLQNKVHIRRMGKKTSLGNETKVIWRLNIDISIYREPIRR
jgi:hypothetical protein